MPIQTVRTRTVMAGINPIRPVLRNSKGENFVSSVNLRRALCVLIGAVVASAVLAIAGECGAAMIFIVTDNDGAEAGYATFLEDHSYTVDVSESQEFRGSLSADQRTTLESYDLVIVSRNTSSGSYNRPNDWNTLDVPILLHSPYLSRRNRWAWQADDEPNGRNAADFGVGRVRDDGNPDFLPEDVIDHPVFSGIDFTTVNSAQTGEREGIAFAGSGHGTQTTRDNTGTRGGTSGTWLLSELAYETAVLIDFTDAIGDPFYGDSSQTIHDRRVFFSFTGSYGDFDDIPLTAAGERLLLNTVTFAIPEPGAALLVLWALVCGLLVRRRRG